jgi:hypothetical protein
MEIGTKIIIRCQVHSSRLHCLSSDRLAGHHFCWEAPQSANLNMSHAMSIGTKTIVCPWIFIVRNCTVFPLGVWADITFASDGIGASNAAVVRAAPSMIVTNCFFIFSSCLFRGLQVHRSHEFIAREIPDIVVSTMEVSVK